MTTPKPTYSQSTIARGRKVLSAFLTDVISDADGGYEAEDVVDWLLMKDYLSPTFFESVEDEP